MIKRYILFLILPLLLNSCGDCSSWGDNNLGGEFTLLEGDKESDRIIVYCTRRDEINNCCGGGTYLAPSIENHYQEYIEETKYNDKWVIASSINVNDKSKKYYIIDKEDFDLKSLDCDVEDCDSIIQNHVYGPFDKTTFEKELKEKNINLTLDK